VSAPGALEQPWDAEFEAEVERQRRAETMLMLRGIAILLLTTALVVLRSIAL
jgi:hypothetical protein